MFSLLCNIFINDFSSAASKCLIFQYSDDTVHLTKLVGYSKAVALLQECMYNPITWFANNSFSINKKTTNMLRFKNPLKITIQIYPRFYCSTTVLIFNRANVSPKKM